MSVDARFAEMGARVKVRPTPAPRRQWNPDWMPPRALDFLRFPVLDVRRDGKGEYFDVRVPSGIEMEVIDLDRDARHLLLMARLDRGDKAKYLCGHDERHWFVASVPESYGATTVEEAKRALQPDALKDLTAHLPKAKRIARKNEVYRRQGEWFFVREPDFEPPADALVLHKEPLRRDNRSKPHIVDEAVRFGGEVRWLANTTNRGFTRNRERAREIDLVLGNRTAMTTAQKQALEKQFPEVLWRSVVVNPTMYVRGAVRHSDHSTIVLRGWHRVVMNAEALARSARSIAFID